MTRTAQTRSPTPDRGEEQRDKRRAIPLAQRSAHAEHRAGNADQIPEDRERPREPHFGGGGIGEPARRPVLPPEPRRFGMLRFARERRLRAPATAEHRDDPTDAHAAEGEREEAQESGLPPVAQARGADGGHRRSDTPTAANGSRKRTAQPTAVPTLRRRAGPGRSLTGR